MASQGATLQNYNNELVKCTQLCLGGNMPVKKVATRRRDGPRPRPSCAAAPRAAAVRASRLAVRSRAGRRRR